MTNQNAGKVWILEKNGFTIITICELFQKLIKLRNPLPSIDRRESTFSRIVYQRSDWSKNTKFNCRRYAPQIVQHFLLITKVYLENYFCLQKLGWKSTAKCYKIWTYWFPGPQSEYKFIWPKITILAYFWSYIKM